MAYTPSFNDIPESAGYTPSLADINEISNTPAPSNPSLPYRGAGDIDAGLATAGQELSKFPARVGALLANTGQAIPQLLGVPGATHYDFNSLFGVNNSPTTDFGKTFGVNNPNMLDKGLQNVAQFAPSAALGGEGLAGQAAAGAAYNSTQFNNPAMGAVTGAIGNGLGGLAGKAIAAAPGAVKNYLSQYAAQGMAKNIGNGLDAVKNSTNQQAFNLAKNNFNNMSAVEGNAWNNLGDLAKQADTAGAKFDNSNYVGSLNNKLQDLQGQTAKQSGFARANSDGQDLLNGYINDQHGTFQDAIEHNKALNQDYQNEITPGKSLPFNIVNYAKSNIKQAINDNIDSNNLTSSLGDAWNNANKLTSQKNQIFNNVVNPGGNQQISTFSKLLKGNSDYQDPTTFVKDYIPATRGDGVQKMQQFSQMLGDDNQAKNILKMNYFDKSFDDTGAGIKPNDFINRYNNLSEDQRNYLFNPQENQTIQSLGKILSSHPDSLKSPSFTANIMHSTLPALIGVGAAHTVGAGSTEGLLGGLMAAQAGKAGMNKLFENPRISNYFANYLTKNAPVPVMTGLAGRAPQALLAPQLTQGINSLNLSGGMLGLPAPIEKY